MSYRVFTRTWWKEATEPGWPNNREPGAGRKIRLTKSVATEAEARAICQRYNATHDPGHFSRKAEYEEN